MYRNRIISIINPNDLRKVVNEYTRVTKTSRTIVDYVITNNYGIKSENCRTNKISDHEVINISRKQTHLNNKVSKWYNRQ